MCWGAGAVKAGLSDAMRSNPASSIVGERRAPRTRQRGAKRNVRSHRKELDVEEALMTPLTYGPPETRRAASFRHCSVADVSAPSHHVPGFNQQRSGLRLIAQRPAVDIASLPSISANRTLKPHMDTSCYSSVPMRSGRAVSKRPCVPDARLRTLSRFRSVPFSP